MEALSEINMIVKLAASSVVWPASVPAADTIRKYTPFQKLIKTINGNYPDRLYYRDLELVRNGWRESNGHLYEPPKEWMFNILPDPGRIPAGGGPRPRGNVVLAGNPSRKK